MKKSGDELDQETKVALDRACVAYEQPTECTHCLNLGTRR